MLVNQFSETEPFVQFANQNQATVGGDVRSLEIDFQRLVETKAVNDSSNEREKMIEPVA